MSYPNVLAPWFVVARFCTLDQDGLEYYTSPDGPEERIRFMKTKRDAMLFLNLNTAARVRDANEESFIIVLCSKNDLKSFGR